MKKRFRRFRQANSYLSEINVTPFVDILLVVLVIFMVSAPLLTQTLDIALPQGELEQTSPPPSNQPMFVQVNQSEAIQFDEQTFSLENLEAYLRGLPSYRKERSIHIQMDEEVPHRILIELMLRFKNAGFRQVGLVFEDRPAENLP